MLLHNELYKNVFVYICIIFQICHSNLLKKYDRLETHLQMKVWVWFLLSAKKMLSGDLGLDGCVVGLSCDMNIWLFFW